MPRLWILSDLHLETIPRPRAFRLNPPDFDVLVVAGNVCEGNAGRAVRFVAKLAAGKPAVFVLGNREFWHRGMKGERNTARRVAEEYGVTLLESFEDHVAGVRFLGGTLWTDGRLGDVPPLPNDLIPEPIVWRGKHGDVTNWTVARLHRLTLDVIEGSAYPLKDEMPVVVVTHHAPHPLCLLEGQRTGPAAGSAASDLSYLTDRGRIALWVHGHLHHTVDLTRPGGTRIVCNPAGPGFSNPAFRDDWVIEV